jgi:hypothetical protein
VLFIVPSVLHSRKIWTRVRNLFLTHTIDFDYATLGTNSVDTWQAIISCCIWNANDIRLIHKVSSERKESFHQNSFGSFWDSLHFIFGFSLKVPYFWNYNFVSAGQQFAEEALHLLLIIYKFWEIRNSHSSGTEIALTCGMATYSVVSVCRFPSETSIKCIPDHMALHPKQG